MLQSSNEVRARSARKTGRPLSPQFQLYTDIDGHNWADGWAHEDGVLDRGIQGNFLKWPDVTCSRAEA